MSQHSSTLQRDATAFSPATQGRRVAMGFLLAASFMTMLDVSIVNIALSSIQTSLHVDDRELEWIVASYVLVYAVGLLPLGRLGDAVGRKTMLVAGLACFTLASTLCGAATTPLLLISARVVQGLSAAMISPQIMAIAVTMFEPRERAKAFSAFGLVAGVASIMGAVLGGFLVAADYFGLGWRLVFLVNLPIGLIAIVGAVRYVPTIPKHPDVRVDKVGALLAVLAVALLIVPLVEGRGFGWPAWCFVAIAVSILTAIAFVRWERRQAGRGGALLFPYHLLQNRDYVGGSLAIAVLFSALQGFFLIFALFLQQGLQFSAPLTGLVMTAFSVGMAGSTVIAAHVANLRMKIIVGSLGMALAYAWLWIIVAPGQPVSLVPLFASMFLGGVAGGITIPSLFQTVTRTVPLKDMGSASGAVQVMQQIGGGVGVALVSQIFFGAIGNGPLMAESRTYVAAFGNTIYYFTCTSLIVGLLVLVMRFRTPDRPPT